MVARTNPHGGDQGFELVARGLLRAVPLQIRRVAYEDTVAIRLKKVENLLERHSRSIHRPGLECRIEIPQASAEPVPTFPLCRVATVPLALVDVDNQAVLVEMDRLVEYPLHLGRAR
ncbi:MAG: hypothetical protein MPN21_24270 [Thermoanaerobaculia bacterium]|nr:hypothetical protein [Thermoanaerobaculia bacterium]